MGRRFGAWLAFLLCLLLLTSSGWSAEKAKPEVPPPAALGGLAALDAALAELAVLATALGGVGGPHYTDVDVSHNVNVSGGWGHYGGGAGALQPPAPRGERPWAWPSAPRWPPCQPQPNQCM